MTKHLILGIALAFGSSTALALDDTAFNDWDTDGDGNLSETEFNAGIGESGLYGNWDTNSDGMLDENEFGAVEWDDDWGADFNTWDANADGYLDESETYTGVFDSNDGDESGHWDGDEWDDAGDEGWFDV